MSIPPWLPRPDMPRPLDASRPVPHVIDQRPQNDGTVLVTFAVPYLRRYTVRVPQSVWLCGDHLAIGANAHKALDAFLPPAKPDHVHTPQDDVDQHD